MNILYIDWYLETLNKDKETNKDLIEINQSLYYSIGLKALTNTLHCIFIQ